MEVELLTALRFGADAITSKPGAVEEVLCVLERAWQGEALLLEAIGSLRQALAEVDTNDEKHRLWQAAELLMAREDSELRQEFGAALYSAITNRGWDLRRLQIREALSGTRTSRLLERYRKAAKLPSSGSVD